MRLTFLLALLPTLALSQSPTTSPAPRPEDLSTVTGHITCADTQRPARLAKVRLVPVKIPDDSDFNNEFGVFREDLPSIQTDLSGAYTLRNVSAGRYYLSIDFPGYITPLLGFTGDQLLKPTPKIQQRIQHELQIVTVAAHSTVQADATLRRGASISGTITYDDGTPAPQINIALLRRPDDKGEFQFAGDSGFLQPFTDDNGHYRISSLPDGVYILQATVFLSEERLKTVSLRGQKIQVAQPWLASTLFVYSGDALRLRDAEPITIEGGHAVLDIDITIPISKLHQVSGTLLAKDGHPINDGSIQLLYADDRSPLNHTRVNSDGSFNFLFVPEGNYILSVKDPQDIAIDDTTGDPSDDPEAHPLHTYGTLERPLAVQTDQQPLILTLPEKPATTASDQSTTP